MKLHETGHHELPTHRKLFRFFQECEKTLAPEVADQFEREANNFARFALFRGDAYAQHAADCKCELKTPIKLAKTFGASIYASAREFARTNRRACVVYVLERMEFVEGEGLRAPVRRIEPSPSFAAQFGVPAYRQITPDHWLGSVLPIGRKMTRPVPLLMPDKNGVLHECVAEAFDTTHNVIILLYLSARSPRARLFCLQASRRLSADMHRMTSNKDHVAMLCGRGDRSFNAAVLRPRSGSTLERPQAPHSARRAACGRPVGLPCDQSRRQTQPREFGRRRGP